MIKFFLACFFIFSSSILSQGLSDFNPSSIEISEIEKKKLFPLGSYEENEISKFNNLFDNKTFNEIKFFLDNLPTNNKNHALQNLVSRILNSNFDLKNVELSLNNDLELFEKRIDKLFELAEFKAIDIIYSKISLDTDNDNINLKRIEALFLKDEYKNACTLLDESEFKESYLTGKFDIICSIFKQDFEKARFNLSLLKEKNEPGDNLFIDLCYKIMGDISLSDTDIKLKRLDTIKSLNPILLSSLQIAEISPSFEQVKNAPSSFLTFILSSPTSSLDVKLFSAEKLVKQKKIANSMLAEIYQLITFEKTEIENALQNYKKFSPVRARSLLYQALILEKDSEIRFQIIKSLLKQSKNDKLFSNISFIIQNSVNFFELENLKYEDINLIIEIFYCIGNYDMIEAFYSHISKLDSEKRLELSHNKNFKSKLIEAKISKAIKEQNNFALKDFEIYLNEVLLKKTITKEIQNIILIANIIFDFNDIINTRIFDINKEIKEQKIDSNIIDIYMGLKFSDNNDLFNALKIVFKILNKKEFLDLNELEIFLVLKIFYDLGFIETFEYLSKDYFLYNI